MALLFEWHERKKRTNFLKHAVSFEEATTVFQDPFSLTIPDPLHSEDEDRFVLIGHSRKGRLLIVVHVDRGSRIRLVSAREATPAERIGYEDEKR